LCAQFNGNYNEKIEIATEDNSGQSQERDNFDSALVFHEWPLATIISLACHQASKVAITLYTMEYNRGWHKKHKTQLSAKRQQYFNKYVDSG